MCFKKRVSDVNKLLEIITAKEQDKKPETTVTLKRSKVKKLKSSII